MLGKIRKFWALLLALLLVLQAGAVLSVSAEAELVNLFDLQKTVPGWVNGQGQSSPDPNFCTTEPIKVTVGDTLYFAPGVNTQGWHLITLDENQQALGQVHCSAVSGGALDADTSVMKYMVSEGTAYVRLVVDVKYQDRFLLTKNQPFTAEDYQTLLNPSLPSSGNLFDTTNLTVGWVNSQGQSSPDNSFRTCAPIPVTPGETVYFGAAVTSQGWHLVTLDETQAVIGDATLSTGISIHETLDDATSIMQYTVPAGAAYLRFVADTKYVEVYLVKKEAFSRNEYYDYFELTPPSQGDSETDDLTQIVVKPDSPLLGKKALFCGDSISQGTWDLGSESSSTPNTIPWAWGGRIGEAFQMQADNVSVGGASVSTIRGENRIINQVNRKKNETYDYVVLQGGVNDAWGDPNGTKVAEPGQMSDSFALDSFDTTTFAGGLEELFYYTTQYFPEAKIGYIITFATPNSQGIGRTGDMTDYYRQAIDICEKWGVQYLNLYFDHYVNKTLLNVTTYKYMRDSIHPNTAGYERLTPYIAKWMETMVDNGTLRGNHLYNKTALFCGDSISYGSHDSVGGRAWAGRLAESHHILSDNRSQSGWSVSTARAARIMDQMRPAKDNLYDYVILHGGVNDAWESGPVGQISESTKVSDFDLSTYAGALEELFYYAKTYFPSARIGYIMNFATPNATHIGNCANMEPYYSEAVKICEKWDIPYLDLYHSDYVNDVLLEVTTQQYMADAVHPNSKGYDRLTPYIADWMETLSTWYHIEHEEVGAQEVEEAIRALWPVSYRPQVLSAIESAEAMYYGLSAEAKKQVTNAADLTAARAEYVRLDSLAKELRIIWQADVTDLSAATASGGAFTLAEEEGQKHWSMQSNGNAWQVQTPVGLDLSSYRFDDLKFGFRLRRTDADAQKNSAFSITVNSDTKQRLTLSSWYERCGAQSGKWTEVEYAFSAFENPDSGQTVWPTWTAETWNMNSRLTTLTFGQNATPADRVEIARLAIYDYGERGQALIDAANEVVDQIAAIGEITSLEQADEVAKARAALDALNEIQRNMVTNAGDLQAMEKALEDMGLKPSIAFGDVDGNGKVDAADALKALQHAVKLTTLEGDDATAADVNGDDKIDATDALLMLQYTVKLIDTFPVDQAKA